jgi:hypothetical protein
MGWRYSSNILDLGSRWSWVVSFALWTIYSWCEAPLSDPRPIFLPFFKFLDGFWFSDVGRFLWPEVGSVVLSWVQFIGSVFKTPPTWRVMFLYLFPQEQGSTVVYCILNAHCIAWSESDWLLAIDSLSVSTSWCRAHSGIYDESESVRVTLQLTVSQYVLVSSPLWDLRPDVICILVNHDEALGKTVHKTPFLIVASLGPGRKYRSSFM